MLTLNLNLDTLDPDEMTMLYLAVRSHIPDPQRATIRRALCNLIGEVDAVNSMKHIETALNQPRAPDTP